MADREDYYAMVGRDAADEMARLGGEPENQRGPMSAPKPLSPEELGKMSAAELNEQLGRWVLGAYFPRERDNAERHAFSLMQEAARRAKALEARDSEITKLKGARDRALALVDESDMRDPKCGLDCNADDMRAALELKSEVE